MIKQIAVKNFQSLGSVDLPLGPFTVIVGESDTGKSAVIRAIEAAATNRTGQGFIRKGQSATQVAFVEDDEVRVVWDKDKSATYTLELNGGVAPDSYTYDKARGVPEDVTEVLKLSPIQIGNVVTEPNFHRQFDKPYLVDEPDSAKAKIIGELSGVNLIYLAVQEAKRRQGNANRRLENVERITKELQTKIKEYDWIDARHSVLLHANIQNNVIQSRRDKISSIEHCASAIDEAKVAVDAAQVVIYGLQTDLAALEQVDFDALGRLEAISTTQRNIRLAKVDVDGREIILKAAKTGLKKVEEELSQITVCAECGRPL